MAISVCIPALSKLFNNWSSGIILVVFKRQAFTIMYVARQFYEKNNFKVGCRFGVSAFPSRGTDEVKWRLMIPVEPKCIARRL